MHPSRSKGKCPIFLASCVGAFFCFQQAAAEEFEPVSPGKTALEMTDGHLRASLINGGCEAAFELACNNNEQRSELVSTVSHKSGDRVIYSWDIFIPSEFADTPYASLRATRFLAGDNDPILYFVLDHQYGYEIGRKTCFGPDGYGKWHSVEARIIWDETRKKKLSDKTPAEIHVICDNIQVFSQTGRPNIKEGAKVRAAFGLTAPLGLPENGEFWVQYRNIKIESWQ